MVKVVTVSQMREIEAEADRSGISYAQMMENAGQAIADRVLDLVGAREGIRVTFLIGKGNNGGDGIIAGRILAQEPSISVRYYVIGRDKDDELLRQVASTGFVAEVGADSDTRVLQNLIATTDILIDALFGIGVRLPITGDAARVLRTVNRILQEQAKSESSSYENLSIPPSIHAKGSYVIAIDCPSGLDCDSGMVDSNTINADETISFIAAKPGLLHFPGASTVGDLIHAPIGVPETLGVLSKHTTNLATRNIVQKLLPKRATNSHKGVYGKLLIVAGSANYIGAATLAAEAAYRTGVGLVTIATPSELVPTMSGILQEPTWVPLPSKSGNISPDAIPELLKIVGNHDAMVLGPGIGIAESTQSFVSPLLPQLPAIPLLIDADGLNNLSSFETWWEHLHPSTLITPHSREMSRLTGKSTDDINQHRWETAREHAAKWNIQVLLKGAHSVIAAPDQSLTVLPIKSDALATAGTGDVLAGCIGSLMAQGLSVKNAAICGGMIHGWAGKLAEQELGSRATLAHDVVDRIGSILKSL